MNERIKQLMIQATEYANEQNELHGVGYVITFKEKFAELIVLECQHRVEQYINECGEIASMPKSVIMEHFGVEE